ncbi:MAG: GNAT family N-acetyltransferase [Hyphomicrobiaceae bacterium]
MIIRPERPADIAAIRQVIATAFQDAPYSNGKEADIVDVLRASGALTVSLVAEDTGSVVGHVAFSPVIIDAQDVGWFGLGPVAVLVKMRRRGIAEALIKRGLARIKEVGARGCVVLGEPAFYGRFGFESDPDLRFGDVPPEYFQCLTFFGDRPRGMVDYHPAFLA